jgi:hypothetical protein
LTNHWQPYREPLRVTLVRTGIIALGVGAVLARPWNGSGGVARWTVATLLALWPALGGHFVEAWFLNWLRPRISDGRAVQVAMRVGVWFVGGVGLFLLMRFTAMAIGYGRWGASVGHWWIGGLAFVAIELVVHLVLQGRGCPSFYNGRG